jgi:peptidyl-prolyl cis-trans isomerase C
MRGKIFSIGLLASAFALAACGGGSEKEATLDKGQVLATVAGKDITIHQLNAELTGLALPSGEQRKTVEKQALQALVGRTILADLARERKIDQSPGFALQRHRTEEALLVQMLQREIASKVQPPTADDASKFISDNPDLFAQRKIFTLEQIQFEAPQDMAKLKAMEPMKTMQEVENFLIETRLKYRKGNTNLDTIGANPDLIRQIAKLPAGEIFIIPQGNAVVASKIVSSRVEPFAGEGATNYAMNLVQQKRVGEATERELAEKIKKAREAVKYQKGYEPPKVPAAPAAPKAPTPAPAN